MYEISNHGFSVSFYYNQVSVDLEMFLESWKPLFFIQSHLCLIYQVLCIFFHGSSKIMIMVLFQIMINNLPWSSTVGSESLNKQQRDYGITSWVKVSWGHFVPVKWYGLNLRKRTDAEITYFQHTLDKNSLSVCHNYLNSTLEKRLLSLDKKKKSTQYHYILQKVIVSML